MELLNDINKVTGGGSTIKTSTVDTSNRQAFNTVFGDQIIGMRIPSLAAQFQYGLPEDDASSIITSTGSIDIVESVLTLSTGTASDGAVIIESTDTVRYIPGHEIFNNFTSYFSEPSVIFQYGGLFDNDNGFYIGYDGTDSQFSFFRKRNGVVEEKIKIDLLTASKYPLNPLMMNVYRISYGYLGVAPITLARLNPDNSWSEIAHMEYTGTSRKTHTTQTFLPLRAEINNNGATVNSSIGVGSIEAGIVDGAGVDVSGRYFAARTGTVNILTNVEKVVGVFRNKTIYNSIENRVKSKLLFISCSSEGNKPVEFKIIKNPIFTNTPTWSDSDVDSVIEYSSDATVDFSSGKLSLDWNLGKSDSKDFTVSEFSISLKPGEYAVFTALSTGASEVNIGIRYIDLF